MSTERGFSKQALAARIAADIPDGSYVNLGIGMPTLVGDALPADKEILLHSENGILGMGPSPTPEQYDAELINAGKQPVTLLTGGSIFHHTDSFMMMRGGHLDICVLGGFEVSEHGDLANWSTGDTSIAPAVGGAMDLAVGAKQVFAMMTHRTKDGRSKVVRSCSYPLTAARAVTRLYTDLAVIAIEDDGMHLVELAPGISLDEVREATEPELHV
ncbi:3-oxoacid CoA-transferase subunit B [Epidermidibacterium keratini]|uniref:3-oxoacid CoA-transferase subunit B n=1 Tax=Epidermidibacterium keratini TaxID=1891644 RepID=A0A7L4YSH8_9ACTN|nr:3-oxoacid CoA-transferase subunit B [Epidermidibacterium keratini]QHC02008.1 3-oxoacid CoA-transferase subunit B [Epidermidibacterium keratini]